MSDDLKFNFNEVEEAEAKFKPRFIPGIHEVVILGLEMSETQNGSEFIGMKLANSDATREHTERFFTNPKVNVGKKFSALDISMRNLKHIASKVANEEEVNAADGLEKLNELLTGKKLRMKFTGEEIMGRNGVYTRVQFGYPPFAESLDVPLNESLLTFDEAYDIKRLPQSPIVEETSSIDIIDNSSNNTETKGDDIPY